MDEIKNLSTIEPFDKENHLVNNAMMKDIVVSKISNNTYSNLPSTIRKFDPEKI